MSLALIDDHQSGLWVVVCTQHVVRTCAAVLTAAFEQYKILYVTPDKITFACRLGMDMAMVLGSPGTSVRSLKCCK